MDWLFLLGILTAHLHAMAGVHNKSEGYWIIWAAAWPFSALFAWITGLIVKFAWNHSPMLTFQHIDFHQALALYIVFWWLIPYSAVKYKFGKNFQYE